MGGPMDWKYADLALAVAERALDHEYRLWGFGEGPALFGILRTGVLLNRPDLIDHVADLVEPTLNDPPALEDHLIPIEVLRLLRRLRAVETAGAERRWLSAVKRAHRPVPGRPPVHRPDLPGLSTLIWVDCMHTDGPGLALTQSPRSAVDALEEVTAVLQDPASGLFSHGYDVATGRTNRVHWGRGQGWALHGLVHWPHDRGPNAGSLRQRTTALLEGLAAYEIDGAWRTVVDDETAPIENSLSALVASAVLAGASTGIIEQRWSPMGERALDAALRAVDTDGGLPVSAATPVGQPDDYRYVETGIYPWGQGPLLLSLVHAHEAELR